MYRNIESAQRDRDKVCCVCSLIKLKDNKHIVWLGHLIFRTTYRMDFSPILFLSAASSDTHIFFDPFGAAHIRSALSTPVIVTKKYSLVENLLTRTAT